MFKFKVRSGGVRHLQFTADGRHLCVSGKRTEEGIEFWDLVTREPVRAGPPVEWFVLHPGGRWAYASAFRDWDELALLDLSAGKTFGLKCTAFHGLGVAVSPDGGRVIASTHTDHFPGEPATARGDPHHRLRCWRHSGAGRPKLEWQRHRTVREPLVYLIAFFPDGDRIATYESRHWGSAKSRISRVAVRDAATGHYLAWADCAGAELVLVSPDGARIVTRSGERLQIWDATNLAAGPTTITEDHDPEWYRVGFEGLSAAFHPSGRILAVTTNGPDVRFYDTASWVPTGVFGWKAGRTRSIAFSPDGTLAAVGCDTGTIVVWDVEA